MNFISNPKLIIPDVSFYQDDNGTAIGINFERMKAAGAVGVIIRAGQNFWNDPDFKINWAAAKAADLPRGTYWLYDSRNSPEAQAVIWRELVGDDLPELGFWADLEESYNGTYKGERNWKKFVLAMEAFYPGSLHGIYTADWWWNGQTVTEPYFWKARPLWVAGYEAGAAFVTLPAPWRGGEAALWQFTASGDGLKYGVESFEIDLNYFNGDVNKFRSYFRLSGEVIIQPPQEEENTAMATYKGTVLATTALNIRSAPEVQTNPSNDIGDLHYQDKIEASDIINGWWKLMSVNGQPVTGYAYSNNGVWIRTDAVIADQPAPEFPQRVGLTFDGTTIKWYVAE